MTNRVRKGPLTRKWPTHSTLYQSTSAVTGEVEHNQQVMVIIFRINFDSITRRRASVVLRALDLSSMTIPLRIESRPRWWRVRTLHGENEGNEKGAKRKYGFFSVFTSMACTFFVLCWWTERMRCRHAIRLTHIQHTSHRIYVQFVKFVPTLRRVFCPFSVHTKRSRRKKKPEPISFYAVHPLWFNIVKTSILFTKHVSLVAIAALAALARAVRCRKSFAFAVRYICPQKKWVSCWR